MLKLLLTISVVLFVTIGCQKELLPTTNEDENQEFKIPDIVMDSLVVTEDGALKFLNPMSYFRILDTLFRWHDPVLDKWEETIGFTSMRKIVNQLIEESDTIRSLQGMSAFVDRYPHLLTLGESGIEPLIPAAFYRMILNEKGYFYVLDDKYVVTDTRLNIFLPDNTSDIPDISVPYY
jgi:hypothetical protein